MSTGICINTKPDKDFEGYFQNLAMDFEEVNELLKGDGCDLSYFMFSAEIFEDEIAEKRHAGATEEQLKEFAKNYDTSRWEDIAVAVKKLLQAQQLVQDYNEDCFSFGKEEFLMELDELIAELTPHATKNLRVQLLSA
ncbi:hypothetical protein ACFQY0_08980 [Haloferula chungangensis]|uniref:Uncharacterized protein n=1 Tax=Haloferula chungangensis TaxID=1048331 RepID=A0ABW2L4N6_9BACT